MNVNEYKEKVIELFKSGKANQEQWEEMAQAVLIVSEDFGCPEIDLEIDSVWR